MRDGDARRGRAAEEANDIVAAGGRREEEWRNNR